MTDTKILELVKSFISGDIDFDEGVSSGLTAIIETSKDYLLNLTKTKEGVGLSALVLGIALKQMKFTGTVDLFPISADPSFPKGKEYCEILGGGIVPCDSLNEFQRSQARVISPDDPAINIPEEFGRVYVSDLLIFSGLFLIFGQFPLDIIKTFISSRK